MYTIFSVFSQNTVPQFVLQLGIASFHNHLVHIYVLNRYLKGFKKIEMKLESIHLDMIANGISDIQPQ